MGKDVRQIVGGKKDKGKEGRMEAEGSNNVRRKGELGEEME